MRRGFWVKRRFFQFVILLGLAHLACTSVGLCWLYRSTCSTVGGGLEQQAWTDLEASGRQFIGSSYPLRPDDLKARLEGNDALSVGQDRAGISYMLVDGHWRLIAPAPARPAGMVVVWTPASETVRDAGQPLRGRITLADGYHLALAYPLTNGAGYLAVHLPESTLTARQAQLTESLPSIVLLTLLWTCVPVGIVIYMIARQSQETMDREHQEARADAMRQTYDLVRTRDAIIVGLAKLAESRDPETGDHLERLSAYSTLLAAALAEHPRFHEQITPTFIKLIGNSSVLHDIGKVGVPDSILLKRGPLTDSERVLMQHHSGIGGRCLREIERRMGSSNYLQMAREIALRHHERWDGSGYPDGLKGEEIPLAARIVALADVYDALSTRRSYKEAFPHERCVTIIREERDRQFDPDIVDVWLTIEDQYREIVRRYAPTAEASNDDLQQADVVSEDESLAVAAGSGTRS
jgi:HD-GYP domain-containing protein (c-di-GMP phosphodiesterase class II)